jgi:hypothetical protein
MSGSKGVALSVVALAMIACQPADSMVPTCGRVEERTLILVAQSVPTATLLPCVDSLPVGWHPRGGTIADGSTTFWLENNVAGFQAVEVRLMHDCDPADAVEVVPAPDEAGARVYQRPTSLEPFRGTRFVLFEGGCVTYTYSFEPGAPARLSLEAEEALSFIQRREIVDYVREEFGQTLCGADAPSCVD